MGKYILKRLVLMIINVLIVTLILFSLIRLLPVSIASSSEAEVRALANHYKSIGCTFSWINPDTKVFETVKGKPILTQFCIFIGNVFKGYLGESTQSVATNGSALVSEIFKERIGVTVQLNIISFIISVPLGILFGVIAALKKNKWEDQVISIIVMLFISIPSFVLALLMQYFLSYKAKLFPLTYSTSNPKSIVLPVFALSFGTIAGITRYMRAELTEVLTSDFMLLARAKGLTRGQATFRHALRNSMVPVMPIIIWNFISILAGSYVIETVFSIPGIGTLIIKAINVTPPDYDVYVVMSGFYTILSFVGALIVDLSYGIVDPRIRMGGKK